MKHGCVQMIAHNIRNGTTTRFAALNVLEGAAIGLSASAGPTVVIGISCDRIETVVLAGKLVQAVLDYCAAHKRAKEPTLRRRDRAPGPPGTRAGPSLTGPASTTQRLPPVDLQTAINRHLRQCRNIRFRTFHISAAGACDGSRVHTLSRSISALTIPEPFSSGSNTGQITGYKVRTDYTKLFTLHRCWWNKAQTRASLMAMAATSHLLDFRRFQPARRVNAEQSSKRTMCGPPDCHIGESCDNVDPDLSLCRLVKYG
jgi:hypothetical protein